MKNETVPKESLKSFPERARYIASDDDDAISSLLREGALYADILANIEDAVELTEPLSLTSDPYSRGVAQAHANIRALLKR